MKTIILLTLIIQMNILSAKDCHDCSVNKTTDINSIATKQLSDIANISETEEEKKIRRSLCLYAGSGVGNWDRFYKKFTDNKIEIEKYYIDHKCGNEQSFPIMQYSIMAGGNFGVDFLTKFLEYLKKREKETGDDKIIYRLLNYTFDPARKLTLLDEYKVATTKIELADGEGPNLSAVALIEKYGAKSYKQLTEEEKSSGYYVNKEQVAKK